MSRVIGVMFVVYFAISNTKYAEGRVVMQNVSILNSESEIDQRAGEAELGRTELGTSQTAKLSTGPD